MFFSGIGRRQTTQSTELRAARSRPRNDDRAWAARRVRRRQESRRVASRRPLPATATAPGTVNGRLCPQCNGTGRVLVTKKFEVSIPKGIGDGQRIRLAGQGGVGLNGGANGDLYLIVKLLDDSTYKRKGDDLYVDLPVSIYDLVLGGEVKVPTMAGQVAMTIPEGTQNNRLLAPDRQGHAQGQGRGCGRPIRSPHRPASAEPHR